MSQTTITLQQLINLRWDNESLDPTILATIKSHDVLKYYGDNVLVSPYNSMIDTLVTTWELHIWKKSRVLENNDMNTIYQEIYFFTQMLNNVTLHVNYYRTRLDQLNTILDVFTEVLRKNNEDKYRKELNLHLNKKDTDLLEVERQYFKPWQATSTSDNKFINTKISAINERSEIMVSFLTWNKLNSTVNNDLKTSNLLIELKRKVSILQSILHYLEMRMKNFQEEIMSGKKIIENLSFLAKFSG